MGKAMSLMVKHLTKPIREFNIENRAHALIGKDKPKPAPKYKSDTLSYERVLKEHPESLQELMKKHDTLDKYLKDVYLTSHDHVASPIAAPASTNPERPLPLDRRAPEEFEYGFYEPTRVSLGKVSLRNALRFLSEHHAEPKIYDSTKIAEEYLLPKETVGNILKYFTIFEIYIPQDKTKAKFFGPGVPRYRIEDRKPKQIEASKKEK